MIEARGGLFKAVPLALNAREPVKLMYILDRLVEHESYWSDFQDDPGQRRVLASAMLASCLTDGSGDVAWEVWRLAVEPELIGLIGFSRVVQGVDAQFHPVFFDGKLRNANGKRELLLRAMDRAFQLFSLHRLSLEIPETAFALTDFARRKLGFRFEAERRTIRQRRVRSHGHIKNRQWLPVSPGPREAELGSRRYQAVRKGGEWLDMLLLSVTRDEFADFVREGNHGAVLQPSKSTAGRSG